MTTVGNMKKHVTSLVETNRSLAADLRASRAVVSKVSRERDSLRRKLGELQSEWQRAMLVEEARDQRSDANTRALVDELANAESDRDETRAELEETRAELDDAISALNEIRDSLRIRLSNIEPTWPAQPSYI